MQWTRKDLLGLEDLSKEEIELVLDTAATFKEVLARPVKKVPALRGKTVATLFFEPSTRTRVSFEMAAKRLSADTVSITPSGSSISKGESLKDTAQNLQALKADIIIVRHASSGAPNFLSSVLKVSVINAGDGSHEHPTQGLLDLYTIREKKGAINGLKVVIIGDVFHSRVARSDIFGLKKLGADITLCGPPSLVPVTFKTMGVDVTYDIERALKGADVVMLLRIQQERMKSAFFPSIGEYSRFFGMTKNRLKLLKPDAIIMHPGPINRGMEVSSEVADCGQSVILDQVTNGLAVRMAVFYLVSLGKGHGSREAADSSQKTVISSQTGETEHDDDEQ